MAIGDVIARLSVALSLNTASFEKSGKKTEGVIGKLKRALVGPVGLAAAVGAVGGALIAMGISAIKAADEISKAAQSIGIGTEELSRLKYAAEQSNVSFAQLQTGVRIMSRNMVAAANGSKAQEAAFARLGVAVVDADGKMRSSTEVLADLADRFSKMPDGAQKTAASFSVMGRAGAQMIPMLNGGRDAFREAMEEAEHFGIVIDEETGRRAEAFESNITRLGGVMSALGTQVAAELLPYLVEFTDWLVDNSKALVSHVKSTAGWASSFVKSIRYAYNETKYLLEYLQYLDGFVPEWMGGTGRKVARPVNQNHVNAVSAMAQQGSRLANAFIGARTESDRLSSALNDLGIVGEDAGDKAGKGISSGIKRGLDEAEQRARELARLMDRIFPDRAAQAIYEAERAAIDAAERAGKMTRDAADEARIALAKLKSEAVWSERDAERARIGDMIGGEPVEGMKNLDDALQRLARRTKDNTVRIAKSFKDMADDTLSALSRLTNSIRGGGFLGVLEAVIGLGLQMGSIGAFGKNISTRLNKVPGYANGTKNHPGGMALVGERGVELVDLPRGSRVHSNRDTMAMARRQVVEIVDTTGLFRFAVNGQIMESAPGIMQGGAALAGAARARSQKWSLA